MTIAMRQFYLKTDPEQPPVPGDRLLLDRDESHHLATVLRGGRQEVLNLVDGRGLRLTGVSCGRKGKLEQVELQSVERDMDELRAPLLTLACAVVKGKRFEWALEKAVELGVHRVIPMDTERGTVAPGSGKRDRYNTIMISALKQSGRAWLPELEETASLREVMAAAQEDRVLFGAVPGDFSDEFPGDSSDGENPVRPWTFFLEEPPPSLLCGLTLLVGPEGGWSPSERDALVGAGAEPVDLNPHVLRTETAAVAGLFALQTIRRRWLDYCDSSRS